MYLPSSGFVWKVRVSSQPTEAPSRGLEVQCICPNCKMYLSKLQNVFAEQWIGLHNAPGCQELGKRGSGDARKVRVFYERKDSQHTLFCCQLSIVAIYMLSLSLYNESHPAFVELLWSFQQKSSCFIKAFNVSHPDPAFEELSTKVILILLS